MKHTILVLNMILMVVTSSEVCAELNCYDNFDEAAGCLSSTNDFGTIYYSVNNGKMTIYGPAQKD
ncbi:MAG: hypothetical protein J6X42_00120 [Alphaproteobacteria bacterium]|nr:hypothetical protein [Alphaproteobacteria bacterium]